jgi:cation diffusion facilitator CzcD-associated flavoprotein CzcO
MLADPMSTRLSVGIIGAGPGGLALGMLLARAGFRDFTIFDREDGVGGTWRINTYPGLACDVKSHLYSYSFDLNPDWSRLWSPRPEILAYFERCADEYGLRPRLKLRTEILSARWEDDTQQWFKPADFSFSGLPAEAASAVSPTAPARRSR